MRGSGRGGGRDGRDGVLNVATTRHKLDNMTTHKEAKAPPPDKPGRPKDWQEQIKADLAAQVEAGGTLYGFRSDGAYIARTKHGDRVIRPPVD